MREKTPFTWKDGSWWKGDVKIHEAVVGYPNLEQEGEVWVNWRRDIKAVIINNPTEEVVEDYCASIRDKSMAFRAVERMEDRWDVRAQVLEVIRFNGLTDAQRGMIYQSFLDHPYVWHKNKRAEQYRLESRSWIHVDFSSMKPNTLTYLRSDGEVFANFPKAMLCTESKSEAGLTAITL